MSKGAWAATHSPGFIRVPLKSGTSMSQQFGNDGRFEPEPASNIFVIEFLATKPIAGGIYNIGEPGRDLITSHPRTTRRRLDLLVSPDLSFNSKELFAFIFAVPT